MPWVKETLFLPDGVSDQDWFKDPNSYPVLMITRPSEWGRVHDEITVEDPDHPIYLVAPLQPLYGLRVRDVEVRYVDKFLYPDWQQWWDYAVTCRISPHA
jgi:hypothetical protein